MLGGASVVEDPLASPGILDYSVVMEDAEPDEKKYIAEWLKWQMSPEQLEHRHPDLSREWSEEIADGAETWFYRSPDEFWEGMCGREGIALVKDGEVLKADCTAMN
tara:strand:- start:249 stop:566 length:318 start_codon:yes stop_codon:yes gene_type:complete